MVWNKHSMGINNLFKALIPLWRIIDFFPRNLRYRSFCRNVSVGPETRFGFRTERSPVQTTASGIVFYSLEKEVILFFVLGVLLRPSDAIQPLVLVWFHCCSWCSSCCCCRWQLRSRFWCQCQFVSSAYSANQSASCCECFCLACVYLDLFH